jgi:hypothetical protein
MALHDALHLEPKARGRRFAFGITQLVEPTILPQRSAAARPNTTRSISELEPSRFAPCTETHAASPMAMRPGTTRSLPFSFVKASP